MAYQQSNDDLINLTTFDCDNNFTSPKHSHDILHCPCRSDINPIKLSIDDNTRDLAGNFKRIEPPPFEFDYFCENIIYYFFCFCFK